MILSLLITYNVMATSISEHNSTSSDDGYSRYASNTVKIKKLIKKQKKLKNESAKRSEERQEYLVTLNNKIQKINHDIQEKEEKLNSANSSSEEKLTLNNLSKELKSLKQAVQNRIQSDEDSTKELNESLQEIENQINRLKVANHNSDIEFDTDQFISSTPKKTFADYILNISKSTESSDKLNNIDARNLKDELELADHNSGNNNTSNSSDHSNHNLSSSDKLNNIDARNLKDELELADHNSGNNNTSNSSDHSNHNLSSSDKPNNIDARNLKDELELADHNSGNNNTSNSSDHSNHNLSSSDKLNNIDARNLKDELELADHNSGNNNTSNSSDHSNHNLSSSDKLNNIDARNLKDELELADHNSGNNNTSNSSDHSNHNLSSSDKLNNIDARNLKDELKESKSKILDRISQFRAINNESMLILKMSHQIIKNRLIILNGKSPPVAGGDEQNTSFSIWGSSGYAISKQASSISIASYTGRILAMIIGGEIALNNSYILGIAYSNIHSYLKFSEALGKSRINSHIVSAYYQKDLDRNVFLQLIGSVTGNNIKNVINPQRNCKFHVYGMGVEGNLSYRHNFTHDMQLVPNIGLKYHNMMGNVYKEQGEYTHLLKISGKPSRMLSSTIGSKIILNSIDINSYLKLIPSLQGSIERNFLVKHQEVAASFASNYGSPEDIHKVGMTRKSKLGYNIGVGTIAQNNNIKLQFDYNYHMQKKYNTHSGIITLKLNI